MMVLFWLAAVAFPSIAQAVLLPLRQPGEGIVNLSTPSPAATISSVYNFALGIGALVAFGIIVYAALEYTTTESSSRRQEAQGRIYQALLGLLLLLGASVVLRFINPDLPQLRNPELQELPAVGVGANTGSYWNLQLCPITPCANDYYDQTDVRTNSQYPSETACEEAGKSKTNNGTEPEDWRCVEEGTILQAPTGTTPGNIMCLENAECVAAMRDLSAAGIPVSSSGGCNDWKEGCTSFVGSSAVPTIVQNIIELQQSCRLYNPSCHFTVTGGTEPGHRTHAPDKAIVDISPDPRVSSYIYHQIGTTSPTPYQWYKDKDRDRYYFRETTPSHWHICFGISYCSQAHNYVNR